MSKHLHFHEIVAGADNSRAMESETILKNEASPKSHTSRGNIQQRIFLFFAFVCVSIATAFAQDIITLKNGDDIQAVVQKIGELDIEYKKFDNPNGPNYTLKKSEIFMIRYENGSKDVFTKQETTQKDPETVVKQQDATPTQSVVQQNPQSDIEQMKKEFYQFQRNRKEMSMFFSKYDDVFYKRYASASKQRNAGAVLCAIGAGLFAGGIVTMVMTTTGEEEEDIAAGGVIAGVGIVFGAVGLPITLTGAHRQKSVVQDFEYKYFSGNGYSYQPSLNFGLTANGVGLALNF